MRPRRDARGLFFTLRAVSLAHGPRKLLRYFRSLFIAATPFNGGVDRDDKLYISAVAMNANVLLQVMHLSTYPAVSPTHSSDSSMLMMPA